MAGAAPAKRAPRKSTGTPARRAAATPAGPPVVLDLDTLSKEKALPGVKIPKRPFTFNLHGVAYELRDPRDVDWKMALTLASNPFLLMRTSLVGADDPVDNPSAEEIQACRERHGLPTVAPAAGTPEAEKEAEDWPEGVTPAVIDRFTAADLPGWKLNALFAFWHDHYAIDLTRRDGILGALLGKTE